MVRYFFSLVDRTDFDRIGVVGKDTTSNHIMEVEKVLGIEAARASIIKEIDYTMSSHGLGVDPRHIMLLGDVMCHKVSLLEFRISFREC